MPAKNHESFQLLSHLPNFVYCISTWSFFKLHVYYEVNLSN